MDMGMHMHHTAPADGETATDPATGVMRHADAGYDIAIECATEQGLNLPMVAATQGHAK